MTGPTPTRRGNTVIEFTLVGIPVIFVLISICEMSRGMWVYHTLAYTVREGARYAIVKGAGCQEQQPPEGQTWAPCATTATVGNVARRIREMGVGLDPTQLNVQLTSPAGTVDCSPLSSCLDSTAAFPPPADPANKIASGNAIGMELQVHGTYPFRSAIAMFWPGAGSGMNFGTFNLPASAAETIQF